MQLPPGAEFVLPNLVLPTIVFLALGLGVGIGIVVSICSYSICLIKSKKKEEDVELDSSRFNSIDRRSLDRNRRTHHLVNPTPVVNKINVGVQKYPERIIPANPSAPGVVDYPKKQRNLSGTDFAPIPRQERLKIPHPKVVDAQNNLGQPTELNFLPEKIFSNEMPKLHNPKVAENKNILDHPTKQNTQKLPQTYGPWYGRAPNKEDKPTIEDIMVVYSDTLCPLLEIIDDSKADTLHRRHKAKGLLYAFFKKCQTLRSPEKVKDLDFRTAILLEHPRELKKFSDALGGLMSRTTKDPYFIFANGEEVKMLESFFKMCDEKESSEKLEELCQSILKRLDLDFDDQNGGSDLIMI